jgi:hypothetical protein
MAEAERRLHETLEALQERTSELECLHLLEQILTDLEGMQDDGLRQIALTIPTGWQHPNTCQARVVLGRSTFDSPGFRASSVLYQTPIIVQDKSVGAIQVCNAPLTVPCSKPTLPREKQKLVETIARRAAQYVSLCSLLRIPSPPEPTDEKRQADSTGVPGRPEPQKLTRDIKQDSSTSKGLCATCDNRETCTYPKPEDGIWHCEEFA